MVAQTESMRALNAGAVEGYAQAGVTSYAWFADPAACGFCQAMDGQTVATGDSFLEVGDNVTADNGSTMPVTYGSVDAPPLHPNCMCSVIPVIG
jgi:hypothetical protein